MYTEYIYFPITLFIISAIYFLIHKLYIKSDNEELFFGFKRKPDKLIERLPIYLFLSFMIVILPFSVLMFLTLLGGFLGVVFGAFVSLYLSHFIIAKLFLEYKLFVKIVITTIIHFLTMALSIYIYIKELIKTNLDVNMYFDINISLILSSIFFWEIFFQVNKLIKQMKNI